MTQTPDRPLPVHKPDDVVRNTLLQHFETAWLQGFLSQALADLPFLPLNLNASATYAGMPVPDATVATEKMLTAAELITTVASGRPPLVILGEAGAGKTVLLLQIAQRVAERAHCDPKAPIPLYLQLGTWALSNEPFAVWVSRELQRLYDLPGRLVQQLLHVQPILFFFDGLDELVNTEDRRACLEQIALWQSRPTTAGIVLGCRTQSYNEANWSSGTVEVAKLEPLSASLRDTIVAEHSASLQAACTANPALNELIRIPLWFSVVARLYALQPTLNLKSRSTAQLAQELLEVSINYRLELWEPATSPDRLRRQLALLARSMERHAQKTVQLADLHPGWLPRPWQRTTHGVIVGTLTGIGFGIGGPLAGLFSFGLTQRFRSPLTWLALSLWAVTLTTIFALLPGQLPPPQGAGPLFIHSIAMLIFTAIMVSISVLYHLFGAANRPTVVHTFPLRHIGWNGTDAWRGMAVALAICFGILGMFGIVAGVAASLVLAGVAGLSGGIAQGRRGILPADQFKHRLRHALEWSGVAGAGLGLSAVWWALPASLWPDPLVIDPVLHQQVLGALSFGSLTAALGGWALVQRLQSAPPRHPAKDTAGRGWSLPGARQGAAIGTLSGIALGAIAGGTAVISLFIGGLSVEAGHSGGRVVDMLNSSLAGLVLGTVLFIVGVATAVGAVSGGLRLNQAPPALTPGASIRRSGFVAGITLVGFTAIGLLGVALVLPLYARLQQLVPSLALPSLDLAVAYDETISGAAPLTALLFALGRALSISLPLALICGGYAWLSHSVVRILLAAQSAAPLAYPRFLQTGVAAGLFYRAGNTYSFTYAALQTYCARLMTGERAPQPMPAVRLDQRKQLAHRFGIAGSGAAILVLMLLPVIVGLYGAQLSEEPAQPDAPTEPLPTATLSMAANGAYAAIGRTSAGSDVSSGRIGILNMGTGTLAQTLQTDLIGLAHLAMSADGSLVAAANPINITIWYGPDGIELGSHSMDFDNLQIITALAVAPDASLVAYGTSPDPHVRLWDLRTDTIRSELVGHSLFVNDVQFSVTGDRLLSHSLTGQSILWDTTTGQAIMGAPGSTELWAAVFSPDGSLMADQAADGTLRIWDTADGRLLQSLPNTLPAFHLAFAPDNRTFAAALLDDQAGSAITFWQLTDGSPAEQIHLRNHASLLIYAPDGARLVAGDTTGLIWIIDTEQFTVQRVLRGHIAQLKAAAFTPDDTLTTLSVDETARRWRINDGGTVHAITWMQQ